MLLVEGDLTTIYGSVDISEALGVIFHERWVFIEGHKKYFKDKCFIHSRPVLLI